MRLVIACALLLAMALTSPALAHVGDAGFVGQADTHGPDRAHVVDAGREVPAPAGGDEGKPLQLDRRARLSGADVRHRLPTSWCGTPRASDNRANEPHNGAHRYHAIYVLPADGRDRFRQIASTLQADVFQASALLERDYGRAIRFDMGTDCGPQYLDISVVRLPQTTAQLQAVANTPAGTLDAVIDGIDAAGFGTIRASDTVESASARTRNYVVWIDGPAPRGACGQATSYDDPTRDASNLNNLGGKVALVFPNASGGFCSSNTVRHEIGHNLGALQSVAPSSFDGAHCADAYEDTMCYSHAPRVASGERGQFFDYGNDDYWDPPRGAPLPWWTANLNRFLCPNAACNVAPASAGNGPEGTDAGAGNGVSRPLESPRPKATVRIKAKRVRRGWKVRLTARGEGRAIVTLRCRRKPRRAMRTVMAKRTRLPRTIRKKVRCATRPRARLLPARPAA